MGQSKEKLKQVDGRTRFLFQLQSHLEVLKKAEFGCDSNVHRPICTVKDIAGRSFQCLCVPWGFAQCCSTTKEGRRVHVVRPAHDVRRAHNARMLVQYNHWISLMDKGRTPSLAFR